jgi:hypothetical protein
MTASNRDRMEEYRGIGTLETGLWGVRRAHSTREREPAHLENDEKPNFRQMEYREGLLGHKKGRTCARWVAQDDNHQDECGKRECMDEADALARYYSSVVVYRDLSSVSIDNPHSLVSKMPPRKVEKYQNRSVGTLTTNRNRPERWEELVVVREIVASRLALLKGSGIQMYSVVETETGNENRIVVALKHDVQGRPDSRVVARAASSDGATGIPRLVHQAHGTSHSRHSQRQDRWNEKTY